MEKVRAQAPGKIMLFGEHAVIYGRPCIVTAIDKGVQVFLKPRKDENVSLTADALGFDNFSINLAKPVKSYPKTAQFIVSTLQNFKEEFGIRAGFDIITKSAIKESGFGTSAAVTVALTKALLRTSGKKLSKNELFRFCYRAMLEVQDVGSGFDIAAATFGGTLYFVTAGRAITPLDAPYLQIVVGHTGIKADSPSIVKDVGKVVRKRGAWAKEIFDQIEEVVREARVAIENNNLKQIGELMNRNQKLLEELGVSSAELNRLIGAARDAGAYGAKLSGAGRGDFMIALVDEGRRERVEDAIESVGGRIINVEVNKKL